MRTITMMIMTSRSAGVVLLGTALAAAAIVESPGQMFFRLDHNHNRALTFDEFLHSEPVFERDRRAEFNVMDQNHDRRVTRQEFMRQSGRSQQRSDLLRRAYFSKVFSEFDIDENGALDLNEVRHLLKVRFLVRPRGNFARIFWDFDSDHSGGLDLFEYMRFDSNFPFDQADPLNGQTAIVDNAIFNVDIAADSFVTPPTGFLR